MAVFLCICVYMILFMASSFIWNEPYPASNIFKTLYTFPTSLPNNHEGNAFFWSANTFSPISGVCCDYIYTVIYIRNQKDQSSLLICCLSIFLLYLSKCWNELRTKLRNEIGKGFLCPLFVQGFIVAKKRHYRDPKVFTTLAFVFARLHCLCCDNWNWSILLPKYGKGTMEKLEIV